MKRYLRIFGGLALAALIIGVPIGYASYRHAQMRNFHIVRDGVLYRSGQMNLSGLQQVVFDYGIRTVVTLRDAADPKDPPPDLLEEEYCQDTGILHVRIAPRIWWSSQGFAPADRGVDRFRAIMDDKANYPVLIHCFAGIHRSGAFCAVYRMEYENWTNAEAIAELYAGGYNTLSDDWDVLDYLEHYVPRRLRPAVAQNPDLEPRPIYHLAKRTKSTKKKRTAE
jgi:predicted protein tyrosine phosphatase